MELTVAFPGNRPVGDEDQIFIVRTDEMVIFGGQAGGPTPLNLVLAGLGMCSGMELLAFCRTRGLPIGELGLCITRCFNEATRRVEEIGVKLLLPPSFPKRHVEPCLRAVSQCSVKKHLEAPLTVMVSTNRRG